MYNRDDGGFGRLFPQSGFRGGKYFCFSLLSPFAPHQLQIPLNMTYPIVKHFDGLNDGLVSVESAKWGGGRFILLEPEGKRGISRSDVVDLNRENIRGFDVREFYVRLAADLKCRGFVIHARACRKNLYFSSICRYSKK